ncbi:MAG TPA: hypothetical protein PLX89_27815, partial [Verrucomicrobiota bacterium]|nr:hypothetical protein [Verrucomicrobiota bacterium]
LHEPELWTALASAARRRFRPAEPAQHELALRSAVHVPRQSGVAAALCHRTPHGRRAVHGPDARPTVDEGTLHEPE